MDYQQITNPNLNITYTGGWCLKAVRDAFGIGARYATATDDWNSGNQHKEQPPGGLSVPVYFSLGTEPAGHVAIHLPDGKVASSTLSGTHKPLYIHPNMADMIRIYAKANRSCTYLGWSEEVNNVPVVRKEEPEMTRRDIIKQNFITVFERWPTPAEEARLDAMPGEPYSVVQQYAAEQAGSAVTVKNVKSLLTSNSGGIDGTYTMILKKNT